MSVNKFSAAWSWYNILLAGASPVAPHIHTGAPPVDSIGDFCPQTLIVLFTFCTEPWALTLFRHWRGGSSPFLLPFPSSSPVSHSLPSVLPVPFNSDRGLGSAVSSPQQVLAEPDHQTHFCAFTGKIRRFRGHISCIFNRLNLKMLL